MSSTSTERSYRLWRVGNPRTDFLDMLFRLLDWVATHGPASESSTRAWMRQALRLSAPDDKRYLDLITVMGYLQQSDGTVIITHMGKEYLTTDDPQTRRNLFAIGFLTDCRGARQVLQALKQLGAVSSAIIYEKTHHKWPDWNNPGYVHHRLNWFMMLGCVQKLGSVYEITVYGNRLLSE